MTSSMDLEPPFSTNVDDVIAVPLPRSFPRSILTAEEFGRSGGGMMTSSPVPLYPNIEHQFPLKYLVFVSQWSNNPTNTSPGGPVQVPAPADEIYGILDDDDVIIITPSTLPCDHTRRRSILAADGFGQSGGRLMTSSSSSSFSMTPV